MSSPQPPWARITANTSVSPWLPLPLLFPGRQTPFMTLSKSPAPSSPSQAFPSLPPFMEMEIRAVNIAACLPSGFQQAVKTGLSRGHGSYKSQPCLIVQMSSLPRPGWGGSGVLIPLCSPCFLLPYKLYDNLLVDAVACKVSHPPRALAGGRKGADPSRVPECGPPI